MSHHTHLWNRRRATTNYVDYWRPNGPQIGAYALQLLRLYLLWPGAGGAKHTTELIGHNLCHSPICAEHIGRTMGLRIASLGVKLAMYEMAMYEIAMLGTVQASEAILLVGYKQASEAILLVQEIHRTFDPCRFHFVRPQDFALQSVLFHSCVDRIH